LLTLKNQSRYAGGFYDVKGTWWDLKTYKTFAYHL